MKQALWKQSKASSACKDWFRFRQQKNQDINCFLLIIIINTYHTYKQGMLDGVYKYWGWGGPFQKVSWAWGGESWLDIFISICHMSAHLFTIEKSVQSF